MKNHIRPTLLTASLTAVLLATPALARADNPFPRPSFSADSPGMGAIQKLLNMIFTYGFVATMIGALLSVLVLVLAGPLGFPQGTRVGKVGLLVSLGGALGLGALWAILGFFYSVGLTF